MKVDGTDRLGPWFPVSPFPGCTLALELGGPDLRVVLPQARRYDPDGAYVRRWVPELARVPSPLVHEPWRLTPLEQKGAGLVIGRDYPMPVVDHGVARARTLAPYARARASK